jgi:hypothetical protein
MRSIAAAALLLIAAIAVPFAPAASLPFAPAASPPFRATLTAPGHTPKVSTRWYYVIRATNLKGKPIAARLTMQIKDPTGSVHAVQYAATKKNIVNWPFTGRFRDYIIWPPSSKLAGYLGGLLLRATVKAKGAKVVLDYRVKPR